MEVKLLPVYSRALMFFLSCWCECKPGGGVYMSVYMCVRMCVYVCTYVCICVNVCTPL